MGNVVWNMVWLCEWGVQGGEQGILGLPGAAPAQGPQPSSGGEDGMAAVAPAWSEATSQNIKAMQALHGSSDHSWDAGGSRGNKGPA